MKLLANTYYFDSAEPDHENNIPFGDGFSIIKMEMNTISALAAANDLLKW